MKNQLSGTDVTNKGQWYKIVISSGEDIRGMEATSLMGKLSLKFRLSGMPMDAKVFRDRNVVGCYVYYFSPSVLDFANDLLTSFKATRCAEPQDLTSLTPITL